MRPPSDNWIEGNISQLCFQTGIAKRSFFRPLHTQAEGSINAKAEGKRHVFQCQSIAELRDRDYFGDIFCLFARGGHVVRINVEIKKGTSLDILSFKLADACRVVVHSRRIVSGRDESIASRDSCGILVRNSRAETKRIETSEAENRSGEGEAVRRRVMGFRFGPGVRA